MSKTYHHFTHTERVSLEQLLSIRLSVSKIADEIGFSRQAVTREIVRNRTEIGRAKTFSTYWNGCAHQKGCRVTNVCTSDCNKLCWRCRSTNCVNHCEYYGKDSCRELLRSPYVCNGCTHINKCGHTRYTYSAPIAQSRSCERLVKSRSGANLTEDERALIVKEIRPLLKQGLSPATVFDIKSALLPLSKRSFYRYVESGAFGSEIISMHLPYKVRYRRSTPSPTRSNIPEESLLGRRYTDFLELPSTVRARAAEGDCVEGLKGESRVLFTLLFRQSMLQLMLVLPRQTSDLVVGELEFLEGCLGSDFPSHLLLDRGSEFVDACGMEESAVGGKRTSVYYCDPNSPQQKGKCENNHRFIRRILPKGTSFEGLTTYEAGKLMSHINSVPRASLGGKSPLEAAREHLSGQTLKLLESELGLTYIEPENLILKPYLLYK